MSSVTRRRSPSEDSEIIKQQRTVMRREVIFALIVVTDFLFVASLARAEQAGDGETQRSYTDSKGVTHLPSFSMPFSALASDAAKQSFIKSHERPQENENGSKSADVTLSRETILQLRSQYDNATEKTVQDLRKTFPVAVTDDIIAGVKVDVVVPQRGVTTKNESRVLMNLHGGGFIFGAHWGGLMESIPIASLGGYTVISVDYRMAPEHSYPAASEDVAAVYESLLRRHRPESIGIYGCSAGGMLTAQSAAWFQTHHLPRPGAIGLIGSGATHIDGGDSYYFAGAFFAGIPPYPPTGKDLISQLALNGYVAKVDPDDPLAWPARHLNVLSKFPPTLVINSTRDPTMSAAVFTHTQLIKAGVSADLHIWEGMRHCFVYDPGLPESRDAYDVIIKFFDKNLARK